jgi:flagellin
MSTVINTNLASLYAQNNLSNAQNNLATSVMRLSSGLRINSAKDDAAGLAISQNMQSQINGVNQSVRNLNDATNLLQVADTSLATIQDMLLRIKQLATQGFNGSMSSNQKSDLVDELKALKTEIDNTSNRALYNGNNLLANKTGYDSTHATRSIAINSALPDDAATAMVTAITTIGAKAQVYTFSDDGAGKLTLTGADGIAGTATVSSAVGTQTLSFGNLGISITLSNTDGTTATGTVIAEAIGDSGGAGAAAKQLKVTGTSPSLIFSSGASSTDFLSIATINTTTDAASTNYGAQWQMTQLGTKIGATTASKTDTATNTNGGVAAGSNNLTYLQTQYLTSLNGGAGIDPTQDQWANAFKALATLADNAVDHISVQRSIYGAQMNQVSYISTNLQSQSTNLQSSKSSIIDTDFAAETAKLTKGQIMQQAATAMLAQANQMPNVVLSLLK